MHTQDWRQHRTQWTAQAHVYVHGASCSHIAAHVRRPGDVADVFHTFFGLCGLALLGYTALDAGGFQVPALLCCAPRAPGALAAAADTECLPPLLPARLGSQLSVALYSLLPAVLACWRVTRSIRWATRGTLVAPDLRCLPTHLRCLHRGSSEWILSSRCPLRFLSACGCPCGECEGVWQGVNAVSSGVHQSFACHAHACGSLVLPPV